MTRFALLVLLALGPLAAHAQPLHRFLNLAVSPDGARIASVEGDAPASGGYPVVRDLVIRPSAGGPAATVALPCGRAPQCWPSDPAWTPDGRRLAFALRTPGSHARSLYTVDAGGADLTLLAHFDGTVGDLRYAADGRLAVLATAGAEKEVGATQAGAPITGDLSGPPPEQRIAVVTNGAFGFVSPPDLYVYEFAWLPGGAGFVGTAAPGDGDANWWTAKLYRLSAAGAAGVLYAPPDAQTQIAHPRVSRDGREVAFIAGLMSDFGSTGGDVWSVSAVGGAARDLTPGMAASAASIAYGCDGALLARLLAGDEARIVRVADRKVLWRGAVSLEGEDAGMALACPSAVTATVRESFTSPPEIAVGPIGAWRELTAVNAGESAPIEVRSLTWKSGSFTVQGWLLTPRGAAGRLPLITVVHGGPAAAVTPRFLAPGTDRALIEHGYALLLPNPRGSFGQGEAFTRANVRDFGHGDLADILAGIDAAARAAPIDETRLGLTGGSYGGFMTMWAVTQTHRFKAAVAAAGISDWLSYYGENGIDEWMIPYFGKSVYDDPAAYARASAIDYIHNVTTPTFAYVGAQDIECPAPQTQEFWHALRDLGVPASMAIYPGEGHGLRDPAHLADAERRTLAWFDRWLK
jgi:dipeptidyl aminopeptidase/acylaminoacyl peptidase